MDAGGQGLIMEDPQQDKPVDLSWLKTPLNKMDFLIIGVLCLITLGIAGYDYINLKEIEQRSLNDCNAHWAHEFESKCAGPY